MRVKIGNVWFAVHDSQPICLELSQHDRQLVANMHPEATKLAYFDDNESHLVTAEQKLAWMKDERDCAS